MELSVRPVTRMWSLVREEKADITAIYFYTIFNGLIQLSLPLGIQAIIGFVLAGTLSASLVVLISLMVFGVLLVGLLQIAQMKFIERIRQKLFVRYAHAFADRIPRLDLKDADATYLPEAVNRFFDAVSLQKSFSKLLLDLPTAFIQILFGLILLSFYHPAFILFGVILVALLWVILYSTGAKGLKTSLTKSQYKYDLVAWLEEMARMVKAFKFSADTQLHIKKADEKTTKYLNERSDYFSMLLLQYRSLVAFKVIITAAMLIVGVLLLLDTQINIGQFVAAEIIIITVINSVEKIIVNLDNAYEVLTSVEKLSSVTEKPVEQSGTYPLDVSTGIRIKATNLEFSYPDRAVLKNVNFDIPANAKVCVTGPDGSGKSTLLKMLTGLYKDIGGSLMINELPVGNYDLQSLRRQTGIFFRNENIFQASLYENLTMGKEAKRSYVHWLTKQVGLHSFLETLPEGYDTMLDPAGHRLPMNLVQKILLVRALAHQPHLVLLEEPWQGMEETHRLNIQQLLLQLPQTTVIIATNDGAFHARAQQVIRL